MSHQLFPNHMYETSEGSFRIEGPKNGHDPQVISFTPESGDHPEMSMSFFEASILALRMLEIMGFQNKEVRSFVVKYTRQVTDEKLAEEDRRRELEELVRLRNSLSARYYAKAWTDLCLEEQEIISELAEAKTELAKKREGN